MKSLKFTDMPTSFLLWRYPVSTFLTHYRLMVPQDMQVVIERDNAILGPYLPGDQLVVGKRKFLFFRSTHSLENIYFIREGEIKPILWGIGDIAYSTESNPTAYIGANGHLLVSILNVRKFVRANSANNKLDMESLSAQIEPYLAEKLRQAISKIVSSLGFEKSINALDDVAKLAANNLEPFLSENGLKADSFILDELFLGNES